MAQHALWRLAGLTMQLASEQKTEKRTATRRVRKFIRG